jgi:phosphoglycolate phosphatase-like HAD superfamily hydrolase
MKNFNIQLKNVKAIVWDLDGTIIDSFDFFVELVSKILQNRAIGVPSHKAFVDNYHGKLHETLQNLLPDIDELTIDEITAEFLIQAVPLHEHDLDSYFFADAIDLAKRAHAADIYQVMVSNRVHKNHGHASPRSIISRPPLKGLIDVAVCGDDSPIHKPDAKVLNAIIKKSGLHATDFLVIGDQFVDAMLAKNLKGRAILVNRNEHDIPHLESLGTNWEDFVTIVPSLDEVELSRE